MEEKTRSINPIVFFAEGHHKDGFTPEQRRAMNDWIDNASVEDARRASKILLLAFAKADRTIERYVKIALQDSLTGIFNQRYFMERLNTISRPEDNMGMIQHGGWYNQEPDHAILFIDLVGLKKLNDNLGHTAGDAAIKALAKRLSEVSRSGEMCARVGGDEFACIVLLDLTENDPLPTIIDRYNKDLEGVTFKLDGKHHPVQAYIAGYVVDPNKTAQENYDIATKQLIEAKAAAKIGRDFEDGGKPDIEPQ